MRSYDSEQRLIHHSKFDILKFALLIRKLLCLQPLQLKFEGSLNLIARFSIALVVLGSQIDTRIKQLIWFLFENIHLTAIKLETSENTLLGFFSHLILIISLKSRQVYYTRIARKHSISLFMLFHATMLHR